MLNSAKKNAKKIKALFVCDQWCAGNPKFGLSEWEGGLIGSLRSTDLADIDVFHFDAYYEEHHERGDAALLTHIASSRPGVICLVLYKMPGSDVNVLKWETLDAIKNVYQIPMVAIWGDLENPEQVTISRALCPYVVVNAATATVTSLARLHAPGQYIYMWVPRDPNIFHDWEGTRDIDVSYLGTPKEDRLTRITYLTSHGVPVTYTGGERYRHLTTEDYADMYRRSKITLSFSRGMLGSHVINARPFEAMLCGAMVLEEAGAETPKLYGPFIDYVPYVSNKDLLEKARYYLAHDDERKRIAQNGKNKTEILYSAKRFWSVLFDRTLGRATEDMWGKILPALYISSLPGFSWFQKIWLLWVDRLTLSKYGYLMYTYFHILTDKWTWLTLVFKNLAFMRKILQNILPQSAFNAIMRVKRKLF